MARKRDNNQTPSLTTLLSPPPGPSPIRTNYNPSNIILTQIEDNRLFNPDPWPMTTTAQHSTVRVSQKGVNLNANLRNLHKGTKAALLFSPATGTLRCVRRKSRREVLFAFNKQRKRGSSGGKYRRNEWSKIKCR